MGIIRTPGKFEGAYDWAPYFYDLTLDGCADYEFEAEGLVFTAFEVRPEDFAKCPALASLSIRECVICWEDAAGFFHAVEVSRVGLSAYIERADRVGALPCGKYTHSHVAGKAPHNEGDEYHMCECGSSLMAHKS